MSAKRELPEFLNVPWGPKDVLVLIGGWFGLQFALGVAIALLAGSVPAIHSFRQAIASGNVGASFALDLAGVAIGIAIVVSYLRKYKVGWPAVGWRRVSVWKALKYLVGIMIIFIVLANVALIAVKLLVPGFNADQAQTNEFTGSINTHRSLALIALVLLPPVFEEMIFRGFIFPALAKRVGVVWGAVAASVLFGIAHGQPNLFVYTTILGLLLCFMYLRLKSIVPGILLHMLNNYLAFLAISSK